MLDLGYQYYLLKLPAESFTQDGYAQLAYSGVYQWWYTISLRTNEMSAWPSNGIINNNVANSCNRLFSEQHEVLDACDDHQNLAEFHVLMCKLFKSWIVL